MMENVAFPKWDSSFEVQTLDKSLFIQFIKHIPGLGFSFVCFLWVSTHWSRTHKWERKSAPGPRSLGHPVLKAFVGLGPGQVPPGEVTGKQLCRNPHASLRHIENREANGFSCLLSGNFKAKCECSCTKIWARGPLEIIQQSYRASWTWARQKYEDLNQKEIFYSLNAFYQSIFPFGNAFFLL